MTTTPDTQQNDCTIECAIECTDDANASLALKAADARPSWDEYFLDLAEQISRRSSDPHTKHGCVLVDGDKRVISTGYNGPVSGLPHELIKSTRPEKYDWFIHAEDNAVAFARCDLRGATAYVTGMPCAPCFRRLLQVGVRRIVHGDRHSACLNDHELEACKAMAEALNVEWLNQRGERV